MPACAGMTVLALIDFMFYSVAFVLLPNHDNGLATPMK